MEIKLLKERIEKKEKQISKLEKKVERLEKNDPYNDLRRAKLDLEDANKTLKKYKEALNIEINKENEEKIEILVEFLKKWKNKASKYYHEEAIRLFMTYQIYRNNLKEIEKIEDYKERLKKDKDEYFRYINEEKQYSPLLRKIRTYKDTYIDEEQLEKELNNEVKRKYYDLVHRISKVVGEIKDCSNLYVASNGSINGIVIGSECKANVETIIAGGYNIQCLHYRVLVNKIKGE